MNLIQQTERWNCGLFALAMLLDEEPATLIEEIGHDGSELIDPSLPEPFGRRSFVIEDFIMLLHKRNLGLIPIDVCAEIEIGDQTVPVIPVDQRDSTLEYYMRRFRGLILGLYSFDRPHLMAWNRTHIYDPMTPKKVLLADSEITIEVFYALVNA